MRLELITDLSAAHPPPASFLHTGGAHGHRAPAVLRAGRGSRRASPVCFQHARLVCLTSGAAGAAAGGAVSGAAGHARTAWARTPELICELCTGQLVQIGCWAQGKLVQIRRLEWNAPTFFSLASRLVFPSLPPCSTPHSALLSALLPVPCCLLFSSTALLFLYSACLLPPEAACKFDKSGRRQSLGWGMQPDGWGRGEGRRPPELPVVARLRTGALSCASALAHCCQNHCRTALSAAAVQGAGRRLLQLFWWEDLQRTLKTWGWYRLARSYSEARSYGS